MLVGLQRGKRTKTSHNAGADVQQPAHQAADGTQTVAKHADVLRPLERQAQQQLQPGGAGLGFGKGQGLGVFVDRVVVGHQRVDGAVGQRGAQRIAVALLAQRRATGGRGCQSSRCPRR
jgi:hypothetical protein